MVGKEKINKKKGGGAVWETGGWKFFKESQNLGCEFFFLRAEAMEGQSRDFGGLA